MNQQPAPTTIRVSFLRRAWVGPAAAVALILIAGWIGLIRPQWDRWQSVAELQDSATIEASELADYEQRLTTLEDEYQAIRRDAVNSVARLDTLVPERINNALLFAELQELVEQTGLVLVSVHVSPEPGLGKPKATSLNISVAGGNYPALKRLLQVLEGNLRLTDVATLSFDAQVQTYSIAARIYSFN